MQWKSFGRLLRQFRIDNEMSLRQFAARVEYDVSNLSKIERGLLPPPPGNLIIRKWANVLGLQKGSSSYQKFIDTASMRGLRAPEGIAERDVQAYLPAFYRALRNKHEDIDAYNKLIDLLRKS